MAEWVKIGTDVVVGGAAGAIDQVLQNQDEKRETEKGEKLGIMAQYGTYYNYGVPIVAILATAFGFLKGDWASRAVIAGSTIAGRKATWHITKRERVVAYSRWTRERQLEAQRKAALEAARKKGARPQVDTGDLTIIPIVSEEAILV